MALQVGKVFATANAKTGGFTTGMAALGTSVLKFKKTALMAFGAVGAAVGGFIGSSVKTYQSYSDELRTAAVVTKQQGEEAQTLEEREKSLDETFKQLGKDTRFTMEEIAAAGTEIGRTGYSVEETKDALWGVVDVASASGENLPMVAEKLTNVAKGFGMEADELGRLGDVFAEASRSHNVTVQSLSEAFKYFGPIANAMDWSFEKATAMMGILGDLGIASGQAGRQFKSVLADWSTMQAGQELPAKSAEVMKKVADSIGMNFGEMQEQIESGELEFMEFLQMMGKSENVVGDLAQLFTKLASAPLAALSGSGELVKDATEHLKENAQGSAAEQARAQEDTLAGQMDILRGSFQKLKADVGEKFGPAIQGFIEDTLVDMVNTLSDWVSEMDDIDEVMESLGDHVPGLTETFTALKKLFQWVVNNKKAAQTAIEGIGGALATWKIASMAGGMASPLGQVAAILGAIATISKMVASNWDEISGFFQEFADRMADVFGTLWENLIENTGLGDMVELIDSLVEKIQSLVEKIKNMLNLGKKVEESQDRISNKASGAVPWDTPEQIEDKSLRRYAESNPRGEGFGDTTLGSAALMDLRDAFLSKGTFQSEFVSPGDVKDLKKFVQDMNPEKQMSYIDKLLTDLAKNIDNDKEQTNQLKTAMERLASAFSNLELPNVSDWLQRFEEFQSGTPWTGSGSARGLAGFVHNREAVIPEHALKQGPGGVLGFLGMTPNMSAVPAQVSNSMNVSIMPNLQEVNVDSSQRVAELSREMQRRFEQVLRGQGKK